MGPHPQLLASPFIDLCAASDVTTLLRCLRIHILVYTHYVQSCGLPPIDVKLERGDNDSHPPLPNLPTHPAAAPPLGARRVSRRLRVRQLIDQLDGHGDVAQRAVRLGAADEEDQVHGGPESNLVKSAEEVRPGHHHHHIALHRH